MLLSQLCTCTPWDRNILTRAYMREQEDLLTLMHMLYQASVTDMMCKASQAQMAERPVEAREAEGSTPSAGTP